MYSLSRQEVHPYILPQNGADNTRGFVDTTLSKSHHFSLTHSFDKYMLYICTMHYPKSGAIIVRKIKTQVSCHFQGRETINV